MDVVFELFVGRPLTYLVIGVLFTAAQFFRPAGADRSSRAFLVAGALWGLAGIWEFAVNRFTPEADIRVDLLLILPALVLASIWALVRGWR